MLQTGLQALQRIEQAAGWEPQRGRLQAVRGMAYKVVIQLVSLY